MCFSFSITEKIKLSTRHTESFRCKIPAIHEVVRIEETCFELNFTSTASQLALMWIFKLVSKILIWRLIHTLSHLILTIRMASNRYMNFDKIHTNACSIVTIYHPGTGNLSASADVAIIIFFLLFSVIFTLSRDRLLANFTCKCVRMYWNRFRNEFIHSTYLKFLAGVIEISETDENFEVWSADDRLLKKAVRFHECSTHLHICTSKMTRKSLNL